MSHWSELYRNLAANADTRDTMRHNSAPLPVVSCSVPSVIGRGYWSGVFAELIAKGVADADERRHREDGLSGAPPIIPVCQQRTDLVFCDFETRCTGDYDLKYAGAWRYAAGSATEILTFVYQKGDGDSLLWTPLHDPGPLVAFATDPAVFFVCFSQFEQAIWRHIMVERHGFAPIPTERWIDMQAVCSYYALPRKLEKVLPVIGARTSKDTAGAALVRSLSRRNRSTGRFPELTPAVLERVGVYNTVDVAGLVDLYALGELPERENQVWELDQRVNQRGIGVDTELVQAAKRIAETTSSSLVAEFAQLTDGLSPYQVAKTRDWLAGQGYSLPNLQEATVAEALEQISPDQTTVRRVLEIRSIVASTSLKKLDAMLACVGSDGRARGLFQYHAATPGRWSGTLLQPQNLPRPTYEIADPEALVAAIKTGEANSLRPWGKPPLEVLAGALRFAVIAQAEAVLGTGDFSMIEACVLLALAGQHDKCELIAQGIDVYRDMAVRIFGLNRDAFLAIPEAKLTVEQKEQRRIGKNTVLGCGYQMGEERFRQQYLRHLPLDEAKALAERVIHSYRREWAPEVPLLWRDLEGTARRAMVSPGGAAVATCGISYRLEQKAGLPTLVCRLLNGKDIHYIDTRLSNKPDRWGRSVWTYWAYRKGKWRKIEPYGGQLTENVVQALARELLVDAMFRFEEAGYRVVMHVHDEIVLEHPEITEAIIKEIMSKRPAWAEKLNVPIAVKAQVTKRYCK